MNSASEEQRVSSQNDGEDRLSELPDEILVHILSFLPTDDAVRTLLIRRFGNLWTLLPSLNFADLCFPKAADDEEVDSEDEVDSEEVVEDEDELDSFEEKLISLGYRRCPCRGCRRHCRRRCRRFVNFVRNVLILHKRTPINVFRISVVYVEYVVDQHACEFANWIRFAVDKEVKELIVRPEDIGLLLWIPLPSCLFTSQFLVALHLTKCSINDLSQVHMRSLRKLSLHYVHVFNETFSKILLGSPSLQELDLDHVDALNEVRFTNPTIEKLKLTEYSGLLDCPNLKVLEFISIFEKHMQVVNVSSIHTVNIGDCSSDDVFYECLKAFCNAELFEFSYDLSEEKGLSDIEHDLPQTRWKRLHILSELDGDELLGICRVLRSSPDLEELVVHTSPPHHPDEGIEDSNMLSQDLPCLMQQLKTVIMRGYKVPCLSVLLLAEYLLRICVNLEKMVILPSENKSSAGEEQSFVKQLLSFPRASTNARVIIGSEVN